MNISTFPTRDLALAAGGQIVSGEELVGKLVGNTFWGDYPGGFRFVGYMDPDGTSVGTNNVGSDNSGFWKIDCAGNTLSVRWDRGWDSTTTQAIALKNGLEFYDDHSGHWRMRISRIATGRLPLVV